MRLRNIIILSILFELLVSPSRVTISQRNAVPSNYRILTGQQKAKVKVDTATVILAPIVIDSTKLNANELLADSIILRAKKVSKGFDKNISNSRAIGNEVGDNKERLDKILDVLTDSSKTELSGYSDTLLGQNMQPIKTESDVKSIPVKPVSTRHGNWFQRLFKRNN